YNASKFIYWFFVFSSIISGFLGAWAFMRRREEALLAAFFGQCKDTAQAVHRWLGKCWAARSQLHQWSHDEAGDNNDEDGGQTKGEGKDFNCTDSQNVDDHGTNDGNGVTSNNGGARSLPGLGCRGSEGSAIQQFVLNQFEVNNDRVCCGANTNDQPGNT